ncbi:MAG: Mobile element protein [uncultured Paraburkholderia sp.]|uniref:IS66-like element accessory protein TnpA n=1 Tax=uncultured Paraburkholderia sp. TaxID=1822466 RepID=UPI0025964F74|nr:transposase [uncultured Paraburkholderia sp.]CAH2903989.1 MAG: Mobile element protein [uncultured Paraburkholderia sp.]CAH2943446.1 MAG: Mobile element protein [uncultured Paraburkholderia sp.]
MQGGRVHRHRTYTLEFEQQVIKETLEPGMSVSIVARRHDINANVVFEWRRQYRDGRLTLDNAPELTAPRMGLLAVDVIDASAPAIRPASNVVSKLSNDIPAPTPAPVCEIEVEIGKRRVTIRGLSAERAETFLQECLK